MESSWPTAWPNVGLTDVLHVFDPNGDVLLQLVSCRTYDPDQAPVIDELLPMADESLALQLEPEIEPDPQEESSLFETPQDDEPLNLQQPPTWIEEDSACDSGASQWARGKERELQSTKAVYLRVSPRHLILASAMFHSMLNPDNFSEGRRLHSEGNLVIKLPDDPAALIILMNIVHGMTRKVPRHVTLDSLTIIANLVNYYQLLEAVEIFSDIWIANLKQKDFPTSHVPDLIPWLFISWVFQKEEEFEQTTRILEYESDGRLLENEDQRFLIPASIVNRIQEHRIKAIERTITVVHEHINKYLTSNIVCCINQKFACDAMVLGSLLKGSAAIDIWPRPEAPYYGKTFERLASQVREMQVLDDCSQQDIYYGRVSSHGVKGSIEASIKSIENEFCGLILDSFIPETQRKKKDNNLTKKEKVEKKMEKKVGKKVGKKKEKKKGKDPLF